MTLIKWNPVVRPSLFGEIDSWFNNIASDFPSFVNETSEWRPSFEVLNSEDAYRVRADLPGMVKKDVDIEEKEKKVTEKIIKKKLEKKEIKKKTKKKLEKKENKTGDKKKK